MTAGTTPAKAESTAAKTFAAVDLGASSGRVIRATLDGSDLHLDEVHRFPNEPVSVNGTLHWDILALYRGVLEGLRRAGPVDSIGIDSWAVDYGLIDGTGALLGNPVHYRDARTTAIWRDVASAIGEERLYATTGLQQLNFNTLYQLAAAKGTPQLSAAQHVLMIPDLIAYWLTGQIGAEITNASTTQLYDLRTRAWSTELIGDIGLTESLFPPLREPGSVIGRATGLEGSPIVVAVGSHDTASAVVAVPAESDNFAYISCGTWSLVGVELDAPVLSEASRAANFTNEGGVDGTIRYLRNVMGLWLLQESCRAWGDPDLPALIEAAAQKEPFVSVIDPDHPDFLAPGDLPSRIAEFCRRTDQPVPTDKAAYVRTILDSLALAHRRTVREAAALSGKRVDVIHVLGGGARNALLCQLTADACGLPVLAGPVEATALGNVLVQARAAGLTGPALADLRALLRDTQQLTRYQPTGDQAPWDAAASRLGWKNL